MDRGVKKENIGAPLCRLYMMETNTVFYNMNLMSTGKCESRSVMIVRFITSGSGWFVIIKRHMNSALYQNSVGEQIASR